MIKIIFPDGRIEEIEGPKQVRHILKSLNILENTVLVAKGEELLTPDRTVNKGETIEIIPVISGGRDK